MIDFLKLKGRILSYSRVSTDLGQEISIVAQKYRIKQWSLFQGYTEDDILEFEDIGISGKTHDKRSGLQQMLKEAKEYDKIVVFSLSRLSRNTKACLELFDDLKKRKIGFVSLSEQLDLSTPSGLLFAQILSSLCEFESNNTSLRVSNSMRMMARNGTLRRKPEWEWKFDGKDKPFIPNEREIEISKYVCKLWDEGLTISQIVSKLRFEGIKARQKKNGQWVEFYGNLVQKILKKYGKT